MKFKSALVLALAAACGAAHAFPTSGSTSAELPGSPQDLHTFGPSDSTSGESASSELTSSVGSVSQQLARADATAAGQVSIETRLYSSALGLNENPFAIARWDGNFVNETATTSEFFVTVATSVGGHVQVTDPDVPPGGIIYAHPDASQTLLGSIHELYFGAGGVDHRLTFETPGQYSFSLGTLAPGASVDLYLRASGGLNVWVGQQYVCSSIDPGPDDCQLLPQTADGVLTAGLSLVSISALPVVPEPGAAWLLAAGLAGLATGLRRRR